jgi:hypothetical protein
VKSWRAAAAVLGLSEDALQRHRKDESDPTSSHDAPSHDYSNGMQQPQEPSSPAREPTVCTCHPEASTR